MAQPAVDGLRVNDIGGHPLRDGGWFRSGLVFRISGSMVGPPEIAHLDTLDLRVLVDLRSEKENRATLVDWAASRRVHYHHEPISLANATNFADVLEEHGVTEADGRAFLGQPGRGVVGHPQDRRTRRTAGAILGCAARAASGLGHAIRTGAAAAQAAGRSSASAVERGSCAGVVSAWGR